MSTLFSSNILQNALFGYFTTPEATVLRLVCKDFKAAVAEYPWYDMETFILGNISSWRACFPKARAANVGNYMFNPGSRKIPLKDADFVHFQGITELNMYYQSGVTDKAFKNLMGIKKLNMGGCNTYSISDVAFQYLDGIEELNMFACKQKYQNKKYIGITWRAFYLINTKTPRLRVLNLEDCDQLDSNIFKYLGGVKHLNIDCCLNISVSDEHVPFIKGIQTLKMKYCRNYLTSEGAAVLKSGLRPIQSITVEAHSGAAEPLLALGLPVLEER